MVHYQNSDKVNVNGHSKPQFSTGCNIIFKDPPYGDQAPVIASPLFETGNVGLPSTIKSSATGYQDPKGKIKLTNTGSLHCRQTWLFSNGRINYTRRDCRQA